MAAGVPVCVPTDHRHGGDLFSDSRKLHIHTGLKDYFVTTQPPPRRNDDLRFTQNFLHNPNLVDRIVRLAGLRDGDTVLEIGPGKGIITRRLAEAVGAEGHVIAVELDASLAETLALLLRPMTQVEIINGDILRFPLADLPEDYVVFSNIPFNITSDLLEYLFDPAINPAQAHLILQKDSLVALNEQGEDVETFKSLMIHPLYEVEVAHPFLKSDFIPQPGVVTALFAFTRRSNPLIAPADYALYKDFLAMASKDRVGEGVWRKLFSKLQLAKLTDGTGLVAGRGLKSQSAEAMLGAFGAFTHEGRSRHELVNGAMAALREEQARRDGLNRAGGHRRKV